MRLDERRGSNGHDVLFLGGKDFINGFDGFIRQLLDFVLQGALIIFRNGVIGFELLEAVHAFAPTATGANPGFFRYAFGVFDKVFAAFFGKCRDGGRMIPAFSPAICSTVSPRYSI